MADNKNSVSKVSRTSPDLGNESLDRLREVFPQFVKDGEVDFDALKEFFQKEGLLASDEKYGLGWAGKSDAFRLIREPATGTLTPQYEESKDWENTQNLFLEGDNLEILKLLQAYYRESVKMIYIDPPYNTGGDFIYKDNFHEDKTEYEGRTGQRANGARLMKNTESGGRYHSDWLTMMYPRLFLAKNLLQDDGVIFISIDDHEVHNLRYVMNEIFGEENFVAQFIWKSRQNKDNRNITGVSVDHEYIMCFSKRNDSKVIKGKERKSEQYTNPDNDPRGPWTSANMVGILPKNLRPNCHYDLIHPETGINYGKPKMGWRYDKSTMEELMKDDRILWPKSSSGRPRRKVFLNELNDQFTNLSSIITDEVYTRNGTKEIESTFGFRAFDFPKPSLLIQILVDQVIKDSGLVLDFFAGSSSTAHAIMQQNAEDGGNRKYIMVQLGEETEEDSEARNAGYNDIAEIARERIRLTGDRVSEEHKDELSKRENSFDVGFKSYQLTASNYRKWQTITDNDDEEALKEQMKVFTEQPLVDDYNEEAVVYEVLLKEGFSLNSEVRNGSETDLGVWYVRDNDYHMAVTFAPKLTKEQVENLGLQPHETFVCLDAALDDTTKVNLNRNFNMKVI